VQTKIIFLFLQQNLGIVKRVYTYILLMLATIVGVSVQATPNVSLLNMGSLQLSSPSQVNFYNPPTRPHAAYKATHGTTRVGALALRLGQLHLPVM